MIYTASFFRKDHWHGTPISISLYAPKWYQGDQLLILAPSKKLLNDWKRGMSEDNYTERFRNELMLISKWSLVRNWLDNLNPTIDLTLLCYEKPGEFCHRNLIFKMVERHRPDCLGLQDRP
jgi:hypothetical protein